VRPSAGSDGIAPLLLLGRLLIAGRGLHEQYRKRRQRQHERMRTALRGHGRRLDAAEVANAAAAVDRRVAVQALAPETAVRRADDVIVPRKRREIAYDRQRLACARFTQETDDARFGVVVVDPCETGAIEIDLIEPRR